jgi:ATP-dependent helicase HrpB
VSPSAPLPIDAALPEILGALQSARNLVLTAEPGAGKTTRVPPSLLEAGIAGEGEIVVSQPRRIAARLAAVRVASELSEAVGERVGYQVRFESKVGPKTRICYATEGLLLRRLRDDPRLSGVTIVAIDELHERHVDTDVLLALLRRLQRGERPDLRILAMSATLDAAGVAAFLDAPVIASPGRTFPVEIEHVDRSSDRPLHTQVAEALRGLGERGLDGGVLVFLPGAREIRDAARACDSIASGLGLRTVTLHGSLSAAEQDRAVRPGPEPKLVLATNVAETSVTIEGIAAVIDTGLARRPSHDPWSGIPTLNLAKISRASAIQRAGRAGRTRPGRCVRLYPRHDFDRRPEHDEPEIARLDLAAAMLDLRVAGISDPSAIAWLTPPPEAARTAADALLERLGAIDSGGALTPVGRRMAKLPVHPRLARLVVEGQARGVTKLATGAAAVLGERPFRGDDRSRGRSGVADVLADLDALRGTEDDGRRGWDRGAVDAVRRAWSQLSRIAGEGDRRPSRTPQDDLCMALLVAFPDRVARVETRAGLPDRLVLAAGGEAELSPASVVHGAELVVALAIEQRGEQGRGRTIVRSAAHIEPEWLIEVAGDALREEVVARFDPKTERIEAFTETRYESLVVERSPCATLPPAATAALRTAALTRGPSAFLDDPAALDAFLARVAFVRAHRPATAELGPADVEAALADLCEGRRSFAELRRADLLAHLRARLPSEDLAAVERLAPSHVSLPGGRRVAVHYEIDRPPWIESRLQDFFGRAQGPSLVDGRVPLVLHLLAPNQRAVQVTTDLASFWANHYPELRRALMRRYPRHDWPEDPRTASPPAPRGRGRR